MPNPRLPRSANVLLKQLVERNKNSKATAVSDPDGFGVRRVIRYDKNSSKFLAKILPVMDDPRIASYDEEDGVVTITFTPTVRADQTHPFPLAEADSVVDGE